MYKLALHIPQSNPFSPDLDPNSRMYSEFLLLKLSLFSYELLFPPISYIVPLYKQVMFCNKTKQKSPLTFYPSIFWQILNSNL